MPPLAPLQRGPWLSLARTVVELGKRFPNYAQGTGWPQPGQEGADRAVDGPSASGRRTPHLVATSVPGRMLERALAQNHFTRNRDHARAAGARFSENEPRRHLAHPGQRKPDSGQVRIDVAQRGDVVETGQPDVAGDRQALGP